MDCEIECGFNVNDETLNFGSRGLADNESYESATLATLKITGRCLGSPLVNATLKHGNIFYSVDNLFGIFKDKECSAVAFSCTFDTIIDVICISPNNSLLYIFFRNGSLQIFENKLGDYQPVYSLYLLELTEVQDIRLFVGSYIESFEQNEMSSKSSLIVVTNEGKIFRLGVTEIKNSNVSVTHEVYHDLKTNVQVTAFGESLLFLNGSNMWIIDLTDDSIISSKQALDIEYAVFANLRVLALLNSGKLVYICPFSLQHFISETDISICSMHVLTDERSVVKHIVAKSAKNESGECLLQLLQPDFSIVYSLKISCDIVIIDAEYESDEVQYISFVNKEDNLDELRFQCVYETDPEKRLFRLFRRKMFDEAERFARTHNIDVSIVNKEKAKLIVEKLRCSSKDIDDLIEILDNLKDKTLILDCCINVESSCTKCEDVLRILKYGCDLDLDKKDTAAKHKQLLCNKLFFRFNIFLSMGYEMTKWAQFSTCYLIDELKMLLKYKEIPKAIILYSHMSKEEITQLDQDYIEEVFEVLNCLHLDRVVPFLPTFMPQTLQWLPATLPIFVSWLNMKVFQMEKQYNDNFPQNAIDFLQTTIEYLRIEKQNCTENSEFDKEKIIGNFQRLLKSLHDLQVLKSEYGIRVALKEFMQEPKIVINILLNLELELDVYNHVLQEFTYKFILEHSLNPDEIFWNELMDILNYQESYWVNIVAPILNCITSIELKVKAVEKILLEANLPWSSTVREIGMGMLEYSDPQICNIQELMEKEPMMIVMNKKEYCMKNASCSNMESLQSLVKRIIHCNLPTMISDAFQLCGGRESFEIEVMKLLFHHFIETRNFVNATEVLDDKQVVVKKCLEQILQDIVILSDLMDPATAENYILALNMISKKYFSLAKDELEVYSWKKTINTLNNVHHLNKLFNINTTNNEISRTEAQKAVVNQIIANIVSDYEDNSITIEQLFDSCHNLSRNSPINEEKLLLQCCKMVETNKNELLCRVAEKYLNSSLKVKYCCILTVYLLQNLNVKTENQILENSFIDYNAPTWEKNSGRSLKLALSLITKALSNADVEDLPACLKIVPWVECIYFLKRHKKENQVCFNVFEDCFDIDNVNPSFGSLLAIQKMFNMYISFIVKYKCEEDRFLCYFIRDQESVSEEEFLNEIKDFGRLSMALNHDGETLLPYKLLSTLQDELMIYEDLDVQIKDTLTRIIKEQSVPSLIQSSILMKDINENLLKNSLLWCDYNEAEKFIKQGLQLHKRSISKTKIIAKLGVKIFEHHKNIGPKEVCKEVLMNVVWWEKLKSTNLDYRAFFKADSKERLELLIRDEHFNVKLIKQYCIDYNLRYTQTAYLLYLKYILLNWKPRYEIITNNIGKRTLVMEENQEEQLNKKCVEIVNLIEVREDVEALLHELWGQVNFYHYEIFKCILDISEGHSYKHLKSMLCFLKDYQRINSPSDTEKEKWFSSFPECQTIDPLSEFRLLFNNVILDSKDIWNIMRKEISLKNYTVWFAAIQAFSYLTVDNICSFLVKELVAQGVLKAIKPGDWLCPRHTALFSEIDDCLQHMDNVDMKKTTAAYCLLSNTPEGADQVTIAKITYRYAQEYRSLEPNSPHTISFTKIEKKYQRCLSLQILHMHQLAEQTYIDLIFNTNQLLLALYHDERITSKSGYLSLQCPDINRATDELSELFDVDIVEFRRNLLKECLLDTETSEFNGDISIAFSGKPSTFQKDSSARSEDNMKRAAYICLSNVEFWSNHLLSEGYHSDNFIDSKFYYRSRCLTCLHAISDTTTITNMTKLNMQSFMDYIDQLTLSSILSKFGMQVDMSHMETWSVTMKKLAHIGNPESIKALAQICKILKIRKVRYWEYIIRSAEHFGMFSDLEEYLEYTKSEEYIYEKFYVSAWQRLIDHTITSYLNCIESYLEKHLSQVLFVIQQCPVIFLLDLESSMKKLFKAKKLGASVVLMQYVPKSKCMEYLKIIKSSNIFDNTLKELETLESYGVVTTSVRNLLSS